MPLKKKPKVLFILKFRHQYNNQEKSILKHSGLFNSATFVQKMLVQNGYQADLIQVIDNNDIDREVTLHKPDVVIIEALWVVPEKFTVLQKLHPNVKWIIRLHSELPFLANEGIAIDWINKYVQHPNVFVSLNSDRTFRDVKNYFNAFSDKTLQHKLVYLPNYYPTQKHAVPAKIFKKGDTIHIGCFGAIRPMKNQLLQAVAAIQYAEERKLKCAFHINASRLESKGEEVLKNLRALFAPLKGKHTLVEHEWLDRTDFLRLIRSMDLGLQLSLSETFNIVSADFVSQDVPIVTSHEVRWMPKYFTADATDIKSILAAIKRVTWYDRHFIWLETQWRAMKKYVNTSQRVWLKTLPTFL